MNERKESNPIARREEESAVSGTAESADAGAAPAPSSLIGAAASFAASMARFAASGFKTVDESLHQLRMRCCKQCQYLSDTQCSLCRCFIAKKAWLPHEDCPIGRWPT